MLVEILEAYEKFSELPEEKVNQGGNNLTIAIN